MIDFLGLQPDQVLVGVREPKRQEGKTYGEHWLRTGFTDEWRTILTDRPQQRVSELVPEALLSAYQWQV